jgi:ribosomal protein S18 acetylase RimI-like enzyme
MNIRPATADDAEAIARVHVTTWQEAYRDTFGAALDQLSVPDAAERRRAWLEDPAPGTFTLAGELFGRVAGFANAGPARDDPGMGELYAIYVVPQSWGTGLGPALMAAVLDGLRARGVGVAVLSVLADNQRARRFYEREGWTFEDERDGEHLGVPVREARYRRSLTD